MDFVTLLILAFGLSDDSFAVSLSYGLTVHRIIRRHRFQVATSFAIFQGLFPLIGWQIGGYIRSYVEAWDHWIAFVLLGYWGVKMIKESLEDSADDEMRCVFSWKRIISLSIVTSIDALVVGFSYALSTSNNIITGIDWRCYFSCLSDGTSYWFTIDKAFGR